MLGKIMRGSIEDLSTGESREVEHYLFTTGFELTTIVKVMEINSWVHPDDSIQISIDCDALDCVGGVFSVNLEFTPDSITERDRILSDFRRDSLFVVRGKYGVPRDTAIALYDVRHWTVEPDFSEYEIREVFRINGEGLNKLWPLRSLRSSHTV